MEGVICGNMGTDQWLAMPLKKTSFLPSATINCLQSLRQGWGPVIPPHSMTECWRSYEGGQMCYELQGSAHGMPSVGLSQD